MTMATGAPASSNAPVVGIIVSERIYAGLVIDHELAGPLHSYPSGPAPAEAEDDTALVELPADSVVRAVCELVAETAREAAGNIAAVGIALPGMIRNGVVEEAPNLPQLKGVRIAERITAGLREHGIVAPVDIANDADAVAAGLASRHGKLDRLIRVWTLGTGIGFGRYPFSEGVWEGGHSVVSLDDRERFCGCGGVGHLEGIMGHRSMRLRFLDMEPEEVFAAANRRDGDPRCHDFKKLWHKSLAAVTASSIHMDGPGKFFLTGFNVRFIDMNLLHDCLHQMVKMSPLQSYSLEIVQDDETLRVIGAAVAAEQAAARPA